MKISFAYCNVMFDRVRRDLLALANGNSGMASIKHSKLRSKDEDFVNLTVDLFHRLVAGISVIGKSASCF